MAKNKVTTCGAHVRMDPDGTYRVVVFWRLESGRMQEAEYSGLSWTEAVDVFLAELDCHRPGWELGEGWHQPPLSLEL
jgi:hypothetical protein